MFKRSLLILLIGFVTAEPFLAFTSTTHAQHQVCPNCGMEDTCGDICCCTAADALCGHFKSGLYPSGCNPDSARQFFFSQSAVKFLPFTAPMLTRYSSARTFAFTAQNFPEVSATIFSPPPELESFV